MKKLTFFLIFSCYALFAEETPYNLVISLGKSCEGAYQMEWLGLRQAAYPFDWCITPFEGLYKFIVNDAAHFLERQNLTVHPQWVEDTHYHMLFLHDFDMNSKKPLRNYFKIKAKYKRRIERFFDALNSNQKILFIRVQTTFEQVVLLDELLHTRYPNLSYSILAVDETEEISRDWGLERVKNVYHKNLTDWPGALPEWREILSQFTFSFKENHNKISD